MAESIEHFFNKKDYDGVSKKCAEKLKSKNLSEKEIELYAVSLTRLGMHEKALGEYSKIILGGQPFPSLKYSTAKEFKLSLDKAKNNPDFDEVLFWCECGGGFESCFDKALSVAGEKGASHEHVIGHLSIGLRKVGFGDDEIEHISSAIENIFRGATGQEAILRKHLPFYSPPELSKIFVSGLGWSGSGAIFDYVSEFEDVHKVHGETPYIALGDYSLLSMFYDLEDDSSLLFNTLGFFINTLLGFQGFRCWNDLRFSFHSRSAWRERSKKRAMQAFFSLSVIANKFLLEKGEKRMEGFLNFSEYVINSFSTRFCEGEKAFVLLDNVVPIYKIDAVKVLKNAYFLCSHRDPRSNFASIMKENPGALNGVEGYVEKRYSSLQRVSHKLKAIEGPAEKQGVKILNLQFEDFVLSEGCRAKVANEVGLNSSRAKKFSKFKPWESLRNVLLHQEYPNQDDIRMIEEKLGEFCVEPCVRPFYEQNR